MARHEAHSLREATGTVGLVDTARRAAELLARDDLPHLIVGGLAVQEHGYPRLTLDVDIVVTDVLEAVEFLTANLQGPFRRIPKLEDRLIDTRNQAKLVLLPGGRALRRGCLVNFPEPTVVSEELQFIPVAGLISLKLDSWRVTPHGRLRDKADAVELIIRNNLARNLPVADPVRELYEKLWDDLQAETRQNVHPD